MSKSIILKQLSPKVHGNFKKLGKVRTTATLSTNYSRNRENLERGKANTKIQRQCTNAEHKIFISHTNVVLRMRPSLSLYTALNHQEGSKPGPRHFGWI